MNLYKCLIAGVVAIGTVTFAQAQDPQPEPYKLLRTLQQTQDRIAQGSQVAYEVQRKLLDHIGTKFVRFPKHVWEDAKNSEAAAVFALAGGDPQVGRWLLKNRKILPKYEPILKGAVEFASRNYEKATELLANVDPLAYPGHLGGSLALVKAMLVAKTDPEQAVKLFAKAKLLGPGTLVEEAALRRSVGLFKSEEHLPKLVATSHAYYRQFGRSVFGPIFDQSLAKAVVNFGDAALEMHQANLIDAVKQISPGRQKTIYLMFAKNALVSGKMAFAKFTAATATATKVQGESPASNMRAHLYTVAANVASEGLKEVMGALDTIDAKTLSEDDKKIFRGATKIANAIVQWPPAEAAADTLPEPKEGEENADGNEFFARVDPLIAEADKLLEKLSE